MINPVWRFLCLSGNVMMTIIGAAFIVAFVYGMFQVPHTLFDTSTEQLQNHVGGSEALNPHEIHRREYPEDKIVCYYTQRWGQCFWSNLN